MSDGDGDAVGPDNQKDTPLDGQGRSVAHCSLHIQSATVRSRECRSCGVTLGEEIVTGRAAVLRRAALKKGAEDLPRSCFVRVWGKRAAHSVDSINATRQLPETGWLKRLLQSTEVFRKSSTLNAGREPIDVAQLVLDGPCEV